MKQPSLRACLLVTLGLIIVVAFFSIEWPSLILSRGTTHAQQSSTVVTTLLSNSVHWTDPYWQQSTTRELLRLDMAVVIHDTGGRIVYHAGTYNQQEPVFQEIVVTNGVKQIGTVLIYECMPTVELTQQWLQIGLVLLLLTLATVVCFIVLTILKPLSALSQAAHQIARNDLDFHFPVAPVREVAEVFQSFNMMSEALRASLLRQEKVEQERRLFVSAIAHDLRTPLFSLRGYLEGLATGLADTPLKASKYIGVCQAKAATLERLISDLFAYTQLEYLEQVPRRETLEMGVLIESILECLEPQARKRQVALRIESPSVPCKVEADAHLLTRVFENLLDNALRYTPSEGSVSISWRPEHHRLIFTVADTGPGILECDLPHLFTPLYRGDHSRNRQTGGAGLGLAIARSILYAHGGDLTATNSSEGGAVFIGSLAYREVECPATLHR